MQGFSLDADNTCPDLIDNTSEKNVPAVEWLTCIEFILEARL